MQHSAIYDPRANYTFSQRQDIERRKERLAKIKAAAHSETPVAAPDPSPVLEVKPPVAEPVDAWARRQELLHQPTVWFSIESEIEPVDPARPKIEEIQRVVAEHYCVTRLDLISSRRHAKIVRPRQVAMYLAKTLTLRSLPEIGRKFGHRDHSTVLWAVRKIERLQRTDSVLADNIALMIGVLGPAT